MKKYSDIVSLSVFLLLSSMSWAGTLHLHRGNLLHTDKIDLEWRKQSGNCPTKFPIVSADCYYAHTYIKGLLAPYIDQFSQSVNFTTQNTFLLNVRVSGIDFDSCRMLQQKIRGFTLVTVNKEGCVLD